MRFRELPESDCRKECNASFDSEGDRSVENISSEDICKCRTDGSCQKTVVWSQEYAGENDQRVSGVDVSTGAGGRYFQNERPDKDEGCKECAERKARDFCVCHKCLLFAEVFIRWAAASHLARRSRNAEAFLDLQRPAGCPDSNLFCWLFQYQDDKTAGLFCQDRESPRFY